MSETIEVAMSSSLHLLRKEKPVLNPGLQYSRAGLFQESVQMATPLCHREAKPWRFLLKEDFLTL
jgi:hypothetical protein